MTRTRLAIRGWSVANGSRFDAGKSQDQRETDCQAAYLLRTNLTEHSSETLWRIYVQLSWIHYNRHGRGVNYIYADAHVEYFR